MIRSMIIADCSEWPKDISSSKSKTHISKRENREMDRPAAGTASKGKRKEVRNRMHKTNSREDTVFVGPRKANVHS